MFNFKPTLNIQTNQICLDFKMFVMKFNHHIAQSHFVLIFIKVQNSMLNLHSLQPSI